jgi:glucokinase
MILAADIGGTKTLLQLTHADGTVLREQRYDSAAYADFETLLDEFLRAANSADIAAACIAVAGPVTGAQAKVTNLPWLIRADALQQRFAIPHLRLINDFQAVGYGIDALTANDLLVLQTGRAEAQAPRAVIGAGTGLGEGILVWQQGHYEALPTEGGHVDFAPTSAVQRDFLAYMCERQARLSYEEVLSGKGLVNLYRFFVQRHGATPLALDFDAAAVSSAAERGDEPAAQAVEMFVRIYGAQAGNLALTCLAAGGVYIAGGIAPRLRERIADGSFITAFRDKGPMKSLLTHYPVTLILDTQVGLKGAALVARRLLA